MLLPLVQTRTGRSPVATAQVPAHAEPPSILVLTKDEEVNIRQCLESLSFSDDIVVLDSFSSDRTVEIARSFPNVRVIQRKFDTWSKHSNWALENISFKHPWVYYSDADEVVTPELREEIISRINQPDQPHVAFRLRYKNMFMNRWVRRGGVYPVWIIRLFRPEMIRYEDREVNAHPVMKGSLGDLNEHFIHYSFNKGLVPWFNKHNSYSEMEAREAVRITGGTTIADQVRGAVCGKGGARRRAVKNISFFLPCRAFCRFLYMYFIRAGFLDGRAGFHYAAMISMYEYWIAMKMKEARRPWRDATDELVKKLLAEPQEEAARPARAAGPILAVPPRAPSGRVVALRSADAGAV